MQALKLVQQHNLSLSCQLGQEVGNGADGQAFDLLDDPNKVIKICVLYEMENLDIDQEYLRRAQTLDYLLHNPSPIHACVYEHVKLGEGERLLIDNHKQRYILYYYVMEKLFKLSEDEKKVFHSILSHEDRGIVKSFSSKKLRSVLEGLKMGLDFSEERVIAFVEELKRSKVRHLDLHPRNIMSDGQENYRMIDFDRTLLKT